MLSSRSAELSKLIDEKARPLVEEYAETGRSAAERISQAAQESAERLSTAARDTTDRIRNENDALVEAISARTNETLAAISQRTENATGAMRAVEQSLSANVNSLIERLAESNSGIASLVEQAARNLGQAADRVSEQLSDADQKLDATANRFAESANSAADLVHGSSRLLENNIDRLVSISGQTLSQVGGIVGRFDDHSKVLAQASELLGAAQSNLASTLDERQTALRTLSAGLVKRSEEIEGTLNGLTSLVDGAFTRAEDRTSQIGASLRESLHASFADIGRGLGETQQRANLTAQAMRETLSEAGNEASRAIETTLSDAETRARDLSERLRGSITGSMGDIERLLADAANRTDGAAQQLRDTLRVSVEEAIGRFTGATDEIRRSAQDIRQELDATRTELKRGAFDLPEEAKESAAAMRRAVAEQIKALQDISQLVGRSAQSLDVSEPVAVSRPAPVAQPAPQPAAPRPAAPTAPAAATSAPFGSSVLRDSLPLDRPTPSIAQGVSKPVAQAPSQTPPVTQVLAQPQAPVSRAPDATQRPGEGGWISDLLRGASRDDTSGTVARQPQQAARPTAAEPAQPVRTNGDNRNPRHMVESLNSLSVDIARAIDHDASVDLWRRYQRGERDVFTRRLYTLKGQQTFDDIKRKYEREPEFRTAVDRYIADFEKLLADVARTDRDKTVTQSYLTSDTGKVYTMLAHAAGRFS